MDITLTHKDGVQKTFKNAKFDPFEHHWITFSPRSGPMKGEKISVNLKAYSVQRPTDKGPRVTDSIESITLGHNTARGDCRTCAVDATLASLQAEVDRLWDTQDQPKITEALQKMRQIVRNIQDDPDGLLDTIERTLPRRNGGDA
jgi:hypothetical protein